MGKDISVSYECDHEPTQSLSLASAHGDSALKSATTPGIANHGALSCNNSHFQSPVVFFSVLAHIHVFWYRSDEDVPDLYAAAPNTCRETVHEAAATTLR
ncbi:MAG TPA: hypothetical protein VNH18_01355 [Bryobacteraceae bacterium]|nr:hypothetical protein [Bryobacteraceae bacterium]